MSQPEFSLDTLNTEITAVNRWMKEMSKQGISISEAVGTKDKILLLGKSQRKFVESLASSHDPKTLKTTENGPSSLFSMWVFFVDCEDYFEIVLPTYRLYK